MSWKCTCGDVRFASLDCRFLRDRTGVRQCVVCLRDIKGDEWNFVRHLNFHENVGDEERASIRASNGSIDCCEDCQCFIIADGSHECDEGNLALLYSWHIVFRYSPWCAPWMNVVVE